MTKEISEDTKNELIRNILNSFTISDQGAVQWSGEQIGIYRRNINIFYSILLDDLEFSKKLKEKSYSFIPENNIFFGHELLDIFKKIKNKDEPTFDEFKEELNKKLEEIEKTQIKEFTLVYPLNCNFIKKIDSKIDEDNFEIIPYNDFANTILNIDKEMEEAEEKKDFKKIIYLNEIKKVCNNKFFYFVMKTRARNYFFADEYVTEKLLYIMGLLTFSKRYKNNSFTIIGRPKRISNLGLSKVLIFEDKSLVASGDFNEQISSFEKLDNEDVDNLLNIIKVYNQINCHDIKEALQKGIKTYYEASIEEDLAYSFFKYWVCIESCLLKSKKVTEQEIIKRLKSTVLSEDKYLEIRIDKLYDTRNMLIHELEMRISQSDRNLSKSISEPLIEFLLYNNNRFVDLNELNLFYRFVQEKDESLITDKKVIDIIIEFRKKLSDKYEEK